jgi:hypothetical protein
MKVDVRPGKSGVSKAFRCATFKEGQKKPTCPGDGLRGGGRSQNYIRGDKRCRVGGATSRAPVKRKTRRARKSRK